MEIVSTCKRYNDNSPISPGPYVTVKKPSVQKSLRQFTEFLDVKHKTIVHRLGDDKENCKCIKAGIMFLYSIPKRLRHTKINNQVNNIYGWIFEHPQVVQSPITNDYLKFYIGGKY